jgi:hypothetical protein
LVHALQTSIYNLVAETTSEQKKHAKKHTEILLILLTTRTNAESKESNKFHTDRYRAGELDRTRSPACDAESGSDHVADEQDVVRPVPHNEHLGRPGHRLPPRLETQSEPIQHELLANRSNAITNRSTPEMMLTKRTRTDSPAPVQRRGRAARPCPVGPGPSARRQRWPWSSAGAAPPSSPSTRRCSASAWAQRRPSPARRAPMPRAGTSACGAVPGCGGVGSPGCARPGRRTC